MKKFSNEDWKLFKKHPEKAEAILDGHPLLNKEVCDYISNHEERKSGNGYPKGIKNLKDEFQIIGICHTFSKLIHYQEKKVKEALSELQVGELGNFDFNLLEKFKKLVTSINM